MEKDKSEYCKEMRGLLSKLLDDVDKGRCEVKVICDNRFIKDYNKGMTFTFGIKEEDKGE